MSLLLEQTPILIAFLSPFVQQLQSKQTSFLYDPFPAWTIYGTSSHSTCLVPQKI